MQRREKTIVMKKYVFLILIASIVFTQCKKKEEEVPVIVTPVNPNEPDKDPIQFDIPYANVPNIKDAVMYEVNMRAFSNEGTFKGVENRLDSIKALGVNVLWLMPIHPIGILNNAGELGSPYSVRNYKEVSTEYGTLTDLQNLVKTAHSKNMAVIIDWVANHTAWDNPWISAHEDWYTKDGSGKIIFPAGTNWADVADLNFSNNTMRKFMINAMKYWVLKANIDGFRCDYADGVPYDFWVQAIDSLKTIPNRKYILLAEGASSSNFTAGFDLNYSWDFYNSLKSTFATSQLNSNLLTTNRNEYAAIPSGKHKLRFTTNHDESAWNNTPINYFGGQDGALCAFVLSTYIGGVPLIYNGQEVGRSNKTPFFSKSPINWNDNPTIWASYKKIMQFRNSSNAVKEGSIVELNKSNVMVFKRVLQNEEVLVMVNLWNKASTYTFPGTLDGTTWTNILENKQITLSKSVILQPYEYLILKN
jgi:glycosidase